MFISKTAVIRTTILRNIIFNHTYVSSVFRKHHNYSRPSTCPQYKHLFKNTLSTSTCSSFLSQLHRKWCSKGLIDIDDIFKIEHGKDVKKITDLFPLPRVTLNNFTSKTPTKIFEIHYKQNTVAPRGRKKPTQQNDWTCTYAFVWPEKMKFESSAISKRQAAEKAATQAIHWLYVNQRINSKGEPIYERNVLEEIKSTLNEPIRLTISDKAAERIQKIWADYQDGIKDIYEATFKDSKHRVIHSPAALSKDSTIDEDDDFSENEDDLDRSLDISEIKYHVHPVYGRSIVPPKTSTLDRRNRDLKKIFDNYDEELTALPIDDFREKIISSLGESRVAVIVGAAGCGKSTRVPAAILRHCGAGTSAIVSEPRRVAAIGLAERVANELGEEVGLSVGYQVRLHAKPPKPPCGSILYCTSGVLLRRLQTNPGLEGCSHVIIDEAHERDVNTDVILLLLKRALDINPELKIVIMSATLDTGVFTRYFGDCSVINVPGRSYPVETFHLEALENKFNIKLPNTLKNCQKDGRPQINCQEIAEVIKAIDKNEREGAILVFLPGWFEIKQTKLLLDEHYRQSGIHMILPVHSRLSTEDQTKMFSIPAPGIRKIVLATNVAETSITIPDVVYVVDSGSHKENRIMERTGTASLETVWVSLAGAKQRTGRAGRVQPGHCYRMYTKEKEAEFVPHTTPEILRIPLEQTVLDCKSYAPDELVAEFLSQLPEPPSGKAIKLAVNDLKEIGALTATEQLTRLGGLLSQLTLHPRVGRSLINSAVVGNIVAMSHVAAHCCSNTEVFLSAADRREAIREIKVSHSTSSDYWALHSIQEDWEALAHEKGRMASDQYCARYGLKGDRLAYIRSLSTLHMEQLLKTDMIIPTTEPEELNRFSDIEELMCGVLLSGADALLATNRHVKTKGKMSTVSSVFTSTGERAHIGTESVNHSINKRNSKNNLLAYFGGHHSAERRALVVYKSSHVPPHTALLFCPGDVQRELGTTEEDDTVLTIRKHRLKIHIPTSQAVELLKLREMFWNTLQYYIERNIKEVNYDENVNVSRFKVRLIKAVGRILVEGHREHVEGKPKVNDLEDFTRTTRKHDHGY